MSTTCQSYYTLKNPGDNISKTHEFYTLYYLFQIFKELNSSYFDEDEGPGRPRIYTANIMLPFRQWRHLNKIISCRDLEIGGHAMMKLAISFWIVKNLEKAA